MDNVATHASREHTEDSATTKCRLCAGPTKYLWRRLILRKYDVAYFQCETCGSLQTEAPYWLDEAYSYNGTASDTGACQRSLEGSLAMSAILELLEFRPDSACLDYGAGMGLYARLMRDRGWNYLAYDKYALPYYMDKFRAEPTDRKWEMISAFEVFEHLPRPGDTLRLILEAAKDYVFFATELWNVRWGAQAQSWHYLSTDDGQHVFFYTHEALEMIAQMHGYEFHNLGFVMCFARPDAREKISLLKHPDFGQRILQAFLNHQQNPYQYANADSTAVRRS